jgi:RNA polymerase sigma factor FliA
MGRAQQLEVDVDALWTQWITHRAVDVRERLICHYLPLVEFLARHLGRYIEVSLRPDLFSFGVLGLIDAVEKYRPEVGVRFETYGSRRIRGAMTDGLRSSGWLPRGAEHRSSRVIEKIVPVDFDSAATAKGRFLVDALWDPLEASALDELVLEADHAEVAEAIKFLPDRERKVILDHYYSRRPLAAIGKELGVTESRTCQLHRRALRMLEAILLERQPA